MELTVEQLMSRARLGPGRVLVRRGEMSETTAGGLHVPATVREKQKERTPFGRVLATGQPCTWNPGEYVWFHPHGGYEIEVGNETLLVLKEVEVMMAVEPEPMMSLVEPRP